VSRRAAAALVFAVTLLVSSWSVATKHQLGFLGGASEEGFQLGWNLHRHGTFDGDPRDPYAQVVPPVGSPILRAPAYPYFVAAILTAWARLAPAARSEEPAELGRSVRAAFPAVWYAQAALLAAASALLCLWLASHVPTPVATIVGLLFGTCIYLVVLVGTFQDAVLHLALVVLASAALDRAIVARRHDPAAVLLAGVAWGLATLARATSLPLPLVLLVVLLVAGVGRRVALRTAAVFTLGFVLAISPWTVRNYAMTGRLIAVGAHGNAALWAPTTRPAPRSPNIYRWGTAWGGDGRPILRRVAARSGSASRVYFDHVLALEDELGREARTNVTERPGVYARNVATNFATFNLDMSTFLLQAFNLVQQPDTEVQPHWVSGASVFVPYGNELIFDAMVRTLSLLALAAAVKVRRDPAAIAPLAGYLTFCLTHTLTYVDLFDHAVKLPFLFVLTGLTIASLRAVPLTARRSWGDLVLVTLVIVSGSLTVVLLV
jgi:hypothetical protein